MTILLFRLRNVPDDEITDVRELLDTHHINYYETTAGNWGISMPGLWLRDNQDYDRARALLDEYQAARQQTMRECYLEDRAAGRAETHWSLLRREPVKVVSYLLLITVTLVISIVIFY